MEWRWKTFEQLTNVELYEIMKLRQAVFALEQNIVYQDCDDKDQPSFHMMAWEDKKLVSYLRVLPPKLKYPEWSIGRVVTPKHARGRGLGKEVMRRAMDQLNQQFEKVSIRLSAQAYLEKFYQDFGFKTVKGPYIEEGVEHIEMLRAVI